MKIALDTTLSAVFRQGPSGNPNDTIASIEISPRIYGVRWSIEGYRITTDSLQTYGAARFWLYREFVGPSNEQDSTYNGDSSTDGDANITLEGSQKLIAYWTGADLGSNATIRLWGTVETGR